MISWLYFLWNEMMSPSAHFSVMFWLSTTLDNWRSMSSNCLVFHTSGGISMKLVTFLLLNFPSTVSSSSSVNDLSLISRRQLIFFQWVYTLTMYFPQLNSSWLKAFSLALEMLFFLLISFTICHANRDCLSLTEFLI